MENIYIVFGICVGKASAHTVRGVFTTEARAQQFLNEYSALTDAGKVPQANFLYIEQHPVNQHSY